MGEGAAAFRDGLFPERPWLDRAWEPQDSILQQNGVRFTLAHQMGEGGGEGSELEHSFINFPALHGNL
jgi:hypothetical protein